MWTAEAPGARAARVLVTALALVSGCRQNDEPGEAGVLYAQVQGEYRAWQRAPGYEKRTPTDAPHGDAVEIFVNDELAAALGGGPIEAWPVGAIVAKDAYSADGELEAIALMEKREEGWFYAEYDADGAPLYSGQPALCVDCHASGADSIRAFALP